VSLFSVTIFEVLVFYVVGYGVFVTHCVSQGAFLAEYCGDLITCDDGDSLDQTYLYYFSVKSSNYW